MSVHKFTISFDEELAEEVRKRAGGNVSGWLADAASQRLRLLEAQEILAEYEREHGEITQSELDAVDRQWPV